MTILDRPKGAKEMYEGVSRQGNALYNYVNELAKKDGVEMMVRLDNSVQAAKTIMSDDTVQNSSSKYIWSMKVILNDIYPKVRPKFLCPD